MERVAIGKLPLSEIGRLIRDHKGTVSIVGISAVILTTGTGLVYRVHANRAKQDTTHTPETDSAVTAELSGPINAPPPTDNS